MCGIIGFVGESSAKEVLLDGLKKLEYRGDDSAGIAVLENGEFSVYKTTERVESLCCQAEFGGKMGIGHTRWATHGAPSLENAHPHISMDGKVAVVHNGIIENYATIKENLEKEGVVFKSDTDSEVVPNLIAKYYDGDLVEATKKALRELEGSYALCIMSTKEPDKLVAVKQFSPLVVGLFEGQNFVSSDATAFIAKTNRVFYPKDQELVVLTKNSVSVFSPSGEPVNKEIHTLSLDPLSSEKGGFEHFMLKEIFEQPKVLERAIESRITDGKLCFNEIKLSKETLKSFKKINIVACGSAYHAGVAAKYVLERLTKIPTEVELASEFRYRNPLLSKRTLTIAISQSGETADTLAALEEARKGGSYILSVVNVVGSSIANVSDSVLYTFAGPEISVATTKGYTTQLAVLYLFAIYLAKILNSADAVLLSQLLKELRAMPKKIAEILKDTEEIKSLAKELKTASSIFFIGRNVDYAAALEGSLKLKEISYIHSEAYAAGELKHGTISLIENGTPVIALSAFSHLRPKLLSNIKEVKARGGQVISLTSKSAEEIANTSDHTIFLPETEDLFCPLTEVVPLQLLAYFVSVYKGLDVDKPRNLAKSVTVE